MARNTEFVHMERVAAATAATAATAAAVGGTTFRVELGSPSRPALIRWSTVVAPQVFDSYALLAGDGPVLIDPQIADSEVWAQLVALLGRPPLASVLTGSWHERSAYRLRDEHGLPVWLPAAGTEEMEGQPDHLYREGALLPAGLRPITIHDRYAGDTVLVWPAPGGERVLFSGDVILGQLNPEDTRADHWRRNPGLYLWLHGPGDVARFRTNFAPLLHEAFDLICTAHSVVLRDHPTAALAELLQSGRVVERPMRRGTAVSLVPAEPTGPPLTM